MIRKFINFLIFSNLFISICAVAQVLLTYEILGLQPQISILVLVFTATLGMYNFSMVLSKAKKNPTTNYVKAIWSFENHTLMLGITALCFGISGWIFIMDLNRISQVIMVIAGCISLFYNIPLIEINGKKVGLRNIPIIKIILISGVWMLSCTTLPMVATNYHEVFLTAAIARSVNSFLFVTAITIPFDIRDMYQDKFYHMKTIPIIIGERWSYYLCGGLLLAQMVNLWYFIPYHAATHWGLSLASVLTLLLISGKRFQKNHYYYFIFLDGTLILQYVLVKLFLDL